MYNVINLTDNRLDESVRLFSEDTELDGVLNGYNPDQIYYEAVFNNGKETVQPLVEYIQKIKDELEKQINEYEVSIKERRGARSRRAKELPDLKEFDPRAFWRNPLFKEFENELQNIFGFRTVSINPFIERYLPGSKKFESYQINAYIYNYDRFPIDGLVTDKGFYDKTKSCVMELWLSLGLIRMLEAEEILGIILHEFGHGVDPALVDIRYTETNILTKYITDRKDKINRSEKRYIENQEKENKKHGIVGAIALYVLLTLFAYFPGMFKNIYEWFKMKIMGKEKYEEEKINKIREMVKKDRDLFRRQNYSEAYADNFARMYGYGVHLSKALKKINDDFDKEFKWYIKKENKRRELIIEMTANAMKDVHKTNIHRVRNLMKEYNDDIKDPNTPDKVKKMLQDDLTELEKVLDSYMNDFDNFQNNINKAINEELIKKEEKEK